MSDIQKISTCLWFEFQAEDAANFYIGIFKNSRIGRISRYGTEGQDIHKRPPGSVMTIEFELDGRPFLGLNGGPVFQFNEAISMVIICDTQDEIDYYWNRLSEGGDPNAQQCGWLKDKFGLSWQIVPNMMADLFTGPETEKSKKVMRAMFGMKKLDIAALEAAGG